MWIPITVIGPDGALDLHLWASPDARVADLRAALLDRLGRGADAVPLVLATADGEADPRSGLAAAGVRPGVTLWLVPPGASRLVTRPAARRCLWGIAGPDGGLVVDLPENGTVTLGRDRSNAVVLADTAASRHHAAVDCTPDAVVLRDVASSNGTGIDGERIAGPRSLTEGTVVQIGDNQFRVRLEPDRTPAAPLAPQPDGTLRFDRQQRFADLAAEAEVRLPGEPPERRRGSAGVGWGALSSLVLGVVAFFVFKSLTFLLLSLASTATLLVTALVSAVRARREHARSGRRHEQQRADAQARIDHLVAAERERRWRQAPGPADVVTVAERPGAQLWERRPHHPDFLQIRLGIADQPATVVVRNPDGTGSAPTLRDVPLTVPLARTGTIGLLGPAAHTRAAARWIVLQAAVQSGPGDLRIVVLTKPADPGAARAWDWVRWLPHTRPGDGPLAAVGTDALSLPGRIDELTAVVAQRRQLRDPAAAAPRWLVVVDDLSPNDVPGLAELLQTGPDAGVSVVAVGQLPYRCPVTVTFQDSATVTVRRTDEAAVSDVAADQIDGVVAARAARGLAPLRDPQSRSGAAGLPDRVALLDELPDALDPAAVAARWQRVPRRTDVVVGRIGDGPLTVDLVANGPHALVAGATGWGKSAFLQTLVASLSLANRPDELGFLLIDFKGGAAFAPFAELPHVLEMITNLDGSKVMRRLDSLAGEIQRRQRAMRDAGVEKLSEYYRLADAGALPPQCPARMPRMCIVIDEFAILREKLPDEILRRLVHVATQGRSIGLHLVLGTQTPRGSVPAEIAENTKLRVALHLSGEHSQDVVGTADARLITVPGRGLIRRGQEADVTVFQSAYVGGRTRRAGGPPIRLHQAGFAELGHEPAGTSVADRRDVDELVATVKSAAAGIARAQPPWLPELATELDLATLPPPPGEDVVLVYGQEDWPEERKQPVAAWDLARGTHLLAAGRPRSGRSTLLRSLAASLARYRPDQVHLYVMDCGGALEDLRDLAHCGAYLDKTELARGARLLDRLERVVGGGRAAARTVLIIDDWEIWQQTFGEVDNGTLHEQLVRIVRKGPAAGVHLAVTGGSTLLTSGRTRPLTEASHDRIALPFDADDYGWVGVPPTARPADPHPGLAVRVTAPHRTLQVAVTRGPFPAGSAQDEAGGPWRVDALPDRISAAEARELPHATRPATWVGLGIGGDHLHRLGADAIQEGPGLYVAGERHSGRSTALLAVALDALDRGVEVVAVVPSRNSVLHSLAGAAGVAAVLGVRQPTERQVQLAVAAAGDRPYLVVIDDADQLAAADGARALRQLMLDESTDDGPAVVVAADLAALAAPPPNSLLAEAGRGGTGLVLTPRSARVHLFGALTRLPEAFVCTEPAGRAVLLRRGGASPVQVPYAEAADAQSRPRRTGSVPALLEVTDALAGPAPTTVERLRAIVGELRAAGFDALTTADAEQAAALAPRWRGAPAGLVAAARLKSSAS